MDASSIARAQTWADVLKAQFRITPKRPAIIPRLITALRQHENVLQPLSESRVLDAQGRVLLCCALPCGHDSFGLVKVSMSSDPDKASLIKARYALTILKTAKGADRSMALRMIESLVVDDTTPGESSDVAEAHREAVRKFIELAEALRSARDAGLLWHSADRAARKWAEILGA
jgi:hypothetical protein